MVNDCDNTNELDEQINIIIRQTDLTYEQAKSQLEMNNGNYMKVLETYFGIKKSNVKKQLTINQQIYSEIRHVMDDAAHRFYNEREANKS